MSRIVSRAESWSKVYEAFQNINFAAFDYNSVKQSMLDYVKLYFPEVFNDFIESDELVAILEVFAYFAEITAYRLDLDAHENFLSTAQRKESVLRLAKLISYKASRNSCGRGLVKITSISTSEHIYDSNGSDLVSTQIRWNDRNNQNWKEQFLLLLNRVLEQQFGTVGPSDRKQIDNVLFELYAIDNNTISGGVLPYSVNVSNKSYPMELVPVFLDSLGPRERRPEKGAKFTILYGNDGLGDGSPTTGFFMFTKQGTLQRVSATFDGVTPNQTYNVPILNVNDTDVWINQIDPLTGLIVDDASLTSGRKRNVLLGRSGEWEEVDLSNAQNIVFNTNPNRKKYEIETLADDAIRIIFGDGEFADVPSGLFEIWARTSANETITIPQSSVVEQSTSFTYQDDIGRTQTCSLTFSLISNIDNASASEDIEHVRSMAPSVYYTQDRMVNGRDYNMFMLQDPTILKLRAINRTFAGDSKYIAWHDPSTTYENVKLFGDDMTLYFKNETLTQVIEDWTDPIGTYLEPKLGSMEVVTRLVNAGAYRNSNGQLTLSTVRTTFTQAELLQIGSILTATDVDVSDITLYMYYDVVTASWIPERLPLVTIPSSYIPYPMFIIQQSPYDPSKMVLQYEITKLIVNSQTMKFWNTNLGDRVITYDSLTSLGDLAVVLKANDNRIINLDGSRGTILLERNMSHTWGFEILNQDVYPVGMSDAGLRNIHELVVVPQDINKDGVADYQTVDTSTSEIIDVKITIPPDVIGNVQMPIYWIKGTAVGYSLTCSQQLTRAEQGQTTIRIIKWLYRLGLKTLLVFVNGVYQTPRSYIELSSSSVQVPSLLLNDRVELFNISNGSVINNLANVIYEEYQVPSNGIVPLGFTYTPLKNKMLVFVNGVKQIEGRDYIEVDPDHIQLTSPENLLFSSNVTAPDQYGVEQPVVEITAVYLKVTDPHDVNYTRQIVTTETSELEISLPIQYAQGTNSLLVFVNGIKQPVGEFEGYEELTSQSIVLRSGSDVMHVNDLIEIYVLIDPLNVQSSASEDLVVTRGGAYVEDIDTVNGEPTNILTVLTNPMGMDITIREYAYFVRSTPYDAWVAIPPTKENIKLWLRDRAIFVDNVGESLRKRERGRYGLNFTWLHRTPRYHLIDPSPSNLIDTFIISKGYYLSVRQWLEGRTSVAPAAPTPSDLRTSYGYMLDNKMISDSVILHPGKFKLVFGSKADSSVQASLKVIRASTQSLTDNQLKSRIVNIVREYFDISKWEFGETFYATEMIAAIHIQLSTEIDSVVVVPTSTNNQFGNLFQIIAREDEIIYPDITTADIDIVTSYTTTNLRLSPNLNV